jgi:hypothetical protein
VIPAVLTLLDEDEESGCGRTAQPGAVHTRHLGAAADGRGQMPSNATGRLGLLDASGRGDYRFNDELDLSDEALSSASVRVCTESKARKRRHVLNQADSPELFGIR